MGRKGSHLHKAHSSLGFILYNGTGFQGSTQSVASTIPSPDFQYVLEYVQGYGRLLGWNYDMPLEGLLSCAIQPVAKMQNETGEMIDLYIPRKCSATNRLITAKDHASVQINVGHLDANGIYTGQFSTFALSGFIRAQGDADSALDRLWQQKKVEARQQ